MPTGDRRTRWASQTPTWPSNSTPKLAARVWRLVPGQASTRHRHAEQSELYLLLEGTGRMHVGEEVLSLEPLSAVLVEPDTVRQLFNETDADALWLVVGAPLPRRAR